jgi:23S rRNA (cytosine1962-C5)-methyltransferase
VTIWTLKKDASYRIKLQHPWVYRDELKQAPELPYKGAAVELRSETGEVLARGYGNLQSKLSFRALSFGTSSGNPMTQEFVLYKLTNAWKTRKKLGFKGSFRLCFGEGDGLTGLVIDYYKLDVEKPVQLLAVQILTAGQENIFRAFPDLLKTLIERANTEGLTNMNWDQTAVIYRNDVRVREHEGLREEEARFVQNLKGMEWTHTKALLNAWNWQDTISLNCDLYQGQKTGLFLDQSYNIHSVLNFLTRFNDKKKIRILDICCYVGHWSAQFSHWAKQNGIELEIDLLDISESALKFAEENAKANGHAQVRSFKLDALKDWPLDEKSYDVVICDPPAFVKSAKDKDKGLSAYIRLNTESIKRVVKGGLLVSCSCSGLVERDDFDKALQKSFLRSERQGQLLFRGGNAWDHPARPQFPEGQYLKMNTYLLD